MKNYFKSEIFCISIYKSDRYYNFKKYLKNKRIDYKIIKAISSKEKRFKNLTKTFSYEMFNKFRNTQSPSEREMACYLSHIKAIKKSDKNRSLIILEDDARFKVRLDLFKKIIKKLEQIEHYDIFLLGYSKSDSITEDYLNLVNPFLRFIKLPINKYKYLVGDRYKQTTCGAIGYLITANAKQKILKNEKIFRFADDWEILENIGLKIGYLKPTIIQEDIGQLSTLNHKQHFIRPYITGVFIIDFILSLRRKFIFFIRISKFFIKKIVY